MTLSLFLFLLVYLVFTARAAGGGFGAKYLDKKGKGDGRMPFNLTFLPELLFAFAFGGVAAWATHTLISAWLTPFAVEWLVTLLACLFATMVFVRVTAWSYAWMQTGHGFVLAYGDTIRPQDVGRRQTLSPFVDWLADRLGIARMNADGVSPTANYCRLFMAVKGFLIGLPVGGITLAPTWSGCYELSAQLRRRGFKKVDPHAIAEMGTGVAATLAISLFIVVIKMIAVWLADYVQ